MSNFDFIEAQWPAIHADCRRAESYLSSDPRAACFYSRRAIEVLVGHLYDVLDLRIPYSDDLAARTNDSAFKAVTGVGINQKLNLIRALGNTAVHETKPIAAQVGLHALRELHHVVIWTAFRYSTDPDAVPTAAQFDPALAAKAAPLSRNDVQKLASKFATQDKAHAEALAEKDQLLADYEQQMAQLRAEIKAAQANKTTEDHHDLREAETRDAYIDKLLREVGWALGDKRDTEYKVNGMPNETGIGYVDYVLWGSDGLPLAVVEAKRTGKSADLGQQQAKFYADCLEKEFGRRPVIFYTNGYDHAVWDDAAGYPPRAIAGFFTAGELELMIQRRDTRRPLSAAAVNTAIAGRPYQVRAIKAVGDAFDRKQREALLVMATGWARPAP